MMLFIHQFQRGVGILSILSLCRKHKESRLLNIEGIGSEDDGKALAKSPFTSKIMLPPYLQNQHTDYYVEIYNHLDTRRLKGMGTVPLASSCLRRVHEIHRGHDFQEAVRVRLGCIPTPARLSRGGCIVQVQCKCDRGNASLEHISQTCPLIHGLHLQA